MKRKWQVTVEAGETCGLTPVILSVGTFNIRLWVLPLNIGLPCPEI